MSARKRKQPKWSETPTVDDPAIVELMAKLDPDEFARNQALASEPPQTHGPLSRRIDHDVVQRRAIAWLIEHGLASDRKRPVPVKEYPQTPPGNPRPGRLVGSKADPVSPKEPVHHSLADVKAEPIQWLWEGRFPKGKPTVLLGKMGDGKSTFLAYLAATVTTGGAWPDKPLLASRPASVILLNAEEDEATEVKPRFDSLGGNPARLELLTGVKLPGSEHESGFSLSRDVDMLERLCDKLGDVALVIVDPINSFVHGTSGYNEIEAREMFAPLFAFARRRNVALVLNAHPSKNQERHILDRMSGTGAVLQLARAGWYFSQDPTDPNSDPTKRRRLLSHLKGNIGLTRSALACRFTSSGMHFASKPVPLSAEQVDHLLQRQQADAKASVRPARPKDREEDARAFVRKFLEEKGASLKSTVADQAMQCGHSRGSVCRAFRHLIEIDGVVSQYHPEGDVRWWIAKSEPKVSEPSSES